MEFRPPHELHRRRFSRNLGIGLALGAFVVLVFALTLEKVANGDLMHANDAPGAPGVTTVPVENTP